MSAKKTASPNPLVCDALNKHFNNAQLHEMVTAVREFPLTARLDLKAALDGTLSGAMAPSKTMGVRSLYSHETVTFAHLTTRGDHAVLVAPLQYDEVDAGETLPERCLKNALWLCKARAVPFAVLMTSVQKYGRLSGLHLEIAVPPGAAGLELTRRIFDELEHKVKQAGSYRGKVLSLETTDNYSGGISSIKVHRLRSVTREQVILPGETLELLERNVTSFVAQRDKLRAMRMGIKKGILLYGPPGTGKTHTIHFLASRMKDHTTLLITAEQVVLLEQYVQLARFLQPSIVVLEDVDLIARARVSMQSPCEESLLNKLLNEMDGLREDAMVLFILTTNRPDQLERALTSRPGRIDQAIEFPLPRAEGRRKLLELYGSGMEIAPKLMDFLVQKTDGGSGAFIKELMRRSAQFLLESGGKKLSGKHVESALDEMLFSGGSLNAKLLGFAGKTTR